MRRLGAVLLLVRTSVMSGDWNGVRLGLNAYTDTLSASDRNITVREVFTSLRSGDGNDRELDVVFGQAEISFVTREWENRHLADKCKYALERDAVSGVVGDLERSAVRTHLTFDAMSVGDDLFLDSLETEENGKYLKRKRACIAYMESTVAIVKYYTTSERERCIAYMERHL